MLDEIRRKFSNGEYEYSLHAADQSVTRGISPLDVEEAMESGEIIEDYPSDKYGPSCLLLGRTSDGRALHVQCTHPTRSKIKIVTLYEPNPKQWVDLRVRRTQ